MSEIKLTVHPFEMDTLKEAAKKVQEEAGEAFAEYVILQEQQDRSTTRLADEIADVIQASCNLAMRYDINLQAAMERCEKRNRARGRYPMEDEDAKPCGIYDGDNRGCGGDCGAVLVGVGYLREKSPEEMSATELFGTLKATNSFDCRKILCDDWCDSHYNCETCRNRLLDLLKAAYKREIEEIRCEESCLAEECAKRDKEIERLKKEIVNLTNERDGMKRRLEELSDAGITELHRLLREAAGEAKNVTRNARVYIEKQQGSKDERYGDSGCDSCDCGAERVREHVLSAESPAQEMSEREAVIERLRKIDFAQGKVTLYKIAVAILGDEPAPAPWWSNESHAELRDKLIELLSYEKVPDGE